MESRKRRKPSPDWRKAAAGKENCFSCSKPPPVRHRHIQKRTRVSEDMFCAIKVKKTAVLAVLLVCVLVGAAVPVLALSLIHI